MKPTAVLGTYLAILFIVLLFVSTGWAVTLGEQPKTVGTDCRISWDKTNNPKVTWYQLIVFDRSNQSKKAVRFIPADTTNISCKDAGASHEGLWDVTVQSCFDKSTCGSPSEVVPMHITANQAMKSQ
jgi:hypothetical protein